MFLKKSQNIVNNLDCALYQFVSPSPPAVCMPEGRKIGSALSTQLRSPSSSGPARIPANSARILDNATQQLCTSSCFSNAEPVQLGESGGIVQCPFPLQPTAAVSKSTAACVKYARLPDTFTQRTSMSTASEICEITCSFTRSHTGRGLKQTGTQPPHQPARGTQPLRQQSWPSRLFSTCRVPCSTPGGWISARA